MLFYREYKFNLERRKSAGSLLLGDFDLRLVPFFDRNITAVMLVHALVVGSKYNNAFCRTSQLFLWLFNELVVF